MKRSARVIRKSETGKRAIAVDKEFEEEILDFLQKDERTLKKFKHICDLLLSGLKNRELYDKEEFNEKSRGVRAMKFFKGQENARIYCKEISTRSDQTFIVIMARYHGSKKSQKLTQKERNLIQKVAGYEYEEERIEE